MLSFLGNLLWLLCGGLVSCICWLIAGLLWCATVVGIPIGVQCFKKIHPIVFIVIAAVAGIGIHFIFG